jgi:hypothetical protein
VQGLVLVLAGVMLCCLGTFLSLPSTTSDGSSALAGAKAGHMKPGANGPAPGPEGSYLLMPAEELQETDTLPMNASVLTMLLQALVYFGASVGWLLTTNARRQGVMCCSLFDDRSWLAVAPEGPSLLGVFRL